MVNTRKKLLLIIKNLNLVFLLTILLTALIGWIGDYITNEVFVRFITVLVCLVIIWFVVIKIKFLNKILIHLFLFAIIGTINYFDFSFFYEENGFVIITPPNYIGKVYIKLDDQNSKHRVTPTNKIVIFIINSKGKFSTNSDFHPFYYASIAEFRNHKIYFPEKTELKNGEFLEHDSVDGKYNIFKGEIISRIDSSLMKKQ